MNKLKFANNGAVSSTVNGLPWPYFFVFFVQQSLWRHVLGMLIWDTKLYFLCSKSLGKCGPNHKAKMLYLVLGFGKTERLFLLLKKKKKCGRWEKALVPTFNSSRLTLQRIYSKSPAYGMSEDLWINEEETTSPYLTSTSGWTKAVKNIQLSSILKLSFYLRTRWCKIELMLLSWYIIFHCRGHNFKRKRNQKEQSRWFFYSCTLFQAPFLTLTSISEFFCVMKNKFCLNLFFPNHTHLVFYSHQMHWKIR